MNNLIGIFSGPPDEVGSFINMVIAQLQHPFFMMVFGIAFWFTLEWSVHMKKREKLGLTFWQDQKDEITLTFLGGLMFLVWDDELLDAWDLVVNNGEEVHHELEPFMYLLVGPAVERIVWLYKLVKEGRKNGT